MADVHGYIHTHRGCRYATEWFGPNFNRHEPRLRPAQLNPYFAKWVGRIKMRTSVQRPRVLIVYATVSGNAKQLATRVRLLRPLDLFPVVHPCPAFQVGWAQRGDAPCAMPLCPTIWATVIGQCQIAGKESEAALTMPLFLNLRTLSGQVAGVPQGEEHSTTP